MNTSDFIQYSFLRVLAFVGSAIYLLVFYNCIVIQQNADVIGWVVCFLITIIMIMVLLVSQYDDFKKWKSTLPVKDV